MIRPEGIWQSADNMLTRAGKPLDDPAPKQLHIKCPPLPSGPEILMAFTGLAEFPDGTATLQWIRETLRGETRLIKDLFDYLRDRLTRDIGSYWNNRLILSCGIFEDEKRFYAEIRNVDPSTKKTRRQFDYVAQEITQPMIFIGGSGRDYVSKEDVDLLIAQSQKRPARWEDHLGLLAGVNRRTARNPKSGVSPWCNTAFLSGETLGAQMKRFAKPGDPEGPMGMETIIAGVDFTELQMSVVEHLQRLKTDPTAQMPNQADAGRRATEGRK